MRTASVPYFIGWCCLIAAIYLDGVALPLVIAGGALLGLGAGVMRALAVAEPAVGSLVNILSMGGMLVAAVTVLAAWRSKSLRLSITAVYRLLFPFLITSLLALPLLGLEYARLLAAALYAAYSAAIMLMMMQCAQVSRDRGINPIIIYGYYGTIVYALHDLGFIGGSLAEGWALTGVAPLAVVALIAVWALGLMQFIGTGGFSDVLRGRGRAEPIELVSPRRTASRPASASAPDDAGQPLDLIATQSQIVREHYRLTAREAEVMELIARGHSVARIAESLVVSENIIRTHSKHLYTKLGIHKKQELVDLLEGFRGE